MTDLRDELLRRLKAAMPTSPLETIESLTDQLIELEAYEHDGERIIPIGDRATMVRAWQLAPVVCGKIANDYTVHCSSASSPSAVPIDRARARAKAMGIDLDRALNREDDDDREFMGVRLSTLVTPKGAA
jgi:hypothetical protein